ncbi:MAG: M15 family metallopeptidase [Chloroflexi bacterium]|nr:M15 family metallopeptidase [Chloroflexota bacterium]
MSKEHQVQQKQNKVQRPLPHQNQPPAAELTPAQTGLQNPAQLNGLPSYPTSRAVRQAMVLRMQQQQGNIVTQRLLNGSGSGAPAAAIVQRAPSAAQQAQWETDWNDASLQRYQRHFRGDSRPSGTSKQRYDVLCPRYFDHGIQRPLIYIRDHIVTANFFQFSTPAHNGLAAALTAAETSLKAKGYGDEIPLTSGHAFNPRTTSEGNWSNHADGKAIDFDPDINPRLSNKNQRNVISALTGFDMTKPNPGADAGLDSYDASKAASESFQKNFNPQGLRDRLEILTGQEDFIVTRKMTTRGHLDSVPKGRAASAEDKRLRAELKDSLKELKKEAQSVAVQKKLLKKELKKFENLDDAISKLQSEIFWGNLTIPFLDIAISNTTGKEKNKLKRKKKAEQRAVNKAKKQLKKKEKQRDSDKLRQYARTGFLNLSKDIVTALTDAGLEWGGDWGKPHSKDFMHFEVP